MHRRNPMSALVALSLCTALAACGGGGGGTTGGGTQPAPLPTTSPPAPGASGGAFSCPSSATSFGVGSSGSSTTIARRMVRTYQGVVVPGMLAVTYRQGATIAQAVDGKAAAAGAQTVGHLSFDALGQAVRIVHADPSQLARVRSSLQSLPGVIRVGAVHRVFPQRISQPYFTNDPYFRGASGTSGPLYETSSLPGQWDMHVIGLEDAFAYSQSNNGSGVTNAGALGSTNVRLAIIDTGEDVTQPDIAGANIVRTQCFITNAAGTSQSVGGYVTDPDGHGTDVTGIAAAASNNRFGFAGDAGNVSLMLYRIFPTPDDNCATPNTTDPQCSTSSFDVASAIDDAVNNGANVINLSLGADGSSCTNGTDPDATEGAAIANAIAHNVIVVSAAGNSGAANVDPPGCDTGVIAAGASAYNDGQPNGSSYAGSRPEYVASYSSYGSGSWGLVAPGGDPVSNDNDNLHWIENIWTSTPFDSTDAGDCATDAFGESNDCRILIAGTSMATPHIAGAAALVLSVNPAYQSPAAMKALLCSTADNIGDAHQGCGRLNVYRAVAKAAGDPNLP